MQQLKGLNARASNGPGLTAETERVVIIKRFEAHASQSPQSVALTHEGVNLTYGELNSRADHLASYLRGLGVGPGGVVGLYTERSMEMVVGILGILKAGAAYLPIDTSYPPQRIAFVLSDAEVPVLLTQGHLAGRLPDHSATVVLIDHAEELHPSIGTPVAEPTRENLAYVIYTSGSTGNPKGVLVTHENLARLYEQTEAWFGFNERDVWPLFHSVSFDLSVWEIWGALAYGGRLVIVPYGVSRAPEDFYRLLRSERVTVLTQTPSAFRQLSRAEETHEGGASDLELRLVIFAGENLEPQSLAGWINRHGDQKPTLVNMYGITETTVHSTYRVMTIADLSGPSSGSPIGVPIPDLRIDLLDGNLKPVPPGEIGEMFVGGAGVARGYLNRPELTAQRFLPDPFDSTPGALLYRSGDLARIRPDGELEFLGRADHQVKIRGFRVELGEIEAALARYPLVRESAVVARDDAQGQKRLIAYVAARNGAKLDVADMRRNLLETLPDYMVPSPIIVLPEMPLNTNGKIDRSALPDPASHESATTAPAPPMAGNSTESQVAAIWSSVLGRKVGPDDNFFDLGGTSIDLIEVHSQLREQFGREIAVTELFENVTVGALARHLDGNVSADPGLAKSQDRARQQREALERQKRARGSRA